MIFRVKEVRKRRKKGGIGLTPGGWCGGIRLTPVESGVVGGVDFCYWRVGPEN